MANRAGQCAVPAPRETTTQLILVSKSDGFADTRLAWRPDRGEAIPERYTLRVARSLPIGGRVVDADGQPVAGAGVGFGNRTDPALETRPQSDNFDWPFQVTAETDADGRWRIDRIAKSTIRTIDGSASHPEHVGSESANVSQNPEAAKQLVEGKYVFRLGRAVVARGVVLNSDGQPVAGAKVTVGMLSESRSRETTTLADGTFTVAGCQPGQSPLSAAEGIDGRRVHPDVRGWPGKPVDRGTDGRTIVG
ncbi:MAG: carboxypeptidase regulatory-like domain-containing protein [Verrucomicrobia bacterium]|nr:carboxypeptidase regulatory-like domain-containing protein [Verrucomicrobiota bacterium]